MNSSTPPASGQPPPTLSRSWMIVATLGAIGVLAISMWTVFSVQSQVKIASEYTFPVALDSQRAGAALETMESEYAKAAVTHDKPALDSVDRASAALIVSISSAEADTALNRGRREEIVSLMGEARRLAAEAHSDLSADGSSHLIPGPAKEANNLLRNSNAIRKALATLQEELKNDAKAQLTLIHRLMWIQGACETGLVVGVIIALLLSLRRSLILASQGTTKKPLSVTKDVRDDELTLLRSLIDAIPDFIYVKGSDCTFVLANAPMAQIAGVKTPEELLGKTDFDIFPVSLAQRLLNDDLRVMRTGQALHNQEETIVDSAGHSIHFLTTKVPLRDRKGTVTGVAGVGHNISVRKQMEDALREAELKYRGIFDKAIVGIYQSTPEGRFLSVNSAMAFILGYNSPEEMIDSISDIARQFFVEYRRGVEFMLIMDRIGGVKNFECEVFQKGGGKIWLTMSIRAIRKDGVVIRYEGMCEDITERIQLREQLLQSQKLESVGQLAAGIAHEINTPTQYIGDNVRFLKDAFRDLNALLTQYGQLFSASELLRIGDSRMIDMKKEIDRSDVSYLQEEIPKAIDQTLEGVTHVSTLVSAMKEFSHPSTKEKVPLDLNRAIGSTITVARNEWKYVADLETDFDANVPMISCLPGEFNQVILNLIVNAAHAIGEFAQKGGPKKGKITVKTIDCRDWVEIQIEDSGAGIPDSIRTRIFDPFFTTKEIGKGTGQGLSIARSVIVDKHAGSIHFESAEGKGSTFIVRLPYDGKRLPLASKTNAYRAIAT